MIVMWILTNLTEASFLVVGITLSNAILFAAAVIIKQEKVPQSMPGQAAR